MKHLDSKAAGSGEVEGPVPMRTGTQTAVALWGYVTNGEVPVGAVLRSAA